MKAEQHPEISAHLTAYNHNPKWTTERFSSCCGGFYSATEASSNPTSGSGASVGTVCAAAGIAAIRAVKLLECKSSISPSGRFLCVVS